MATWGAKALGVPLGGLVAIAAISYPLAVALLRVLSLGEVKAALRKEPLLADDRTGDTPTSQN